jgi:hypothetical protein
MFTSDRLYFYGMRKILLALITVGISLSACNSREAEARKLLGEGMKLEGANGNLKAIPVYLEVVKRYPDTQAAATAQARISTIKAEAAQNATAIMQSVGF